MNGKTGRVVLLSVALTALACSAPLQAFSFCFSFGNDNHRSSPYSRYVPRYPLLPGASYPPARGQLLPAATAYTPVYPLPPLQPYEELMPAHPAW